MQAREVFIAIKNKVRFNEKGRDADSHYGVLGNTLVRISNHCSWMKVWDNYLQKNPRDERRNILSLVFEDSGDTFTEECLFTVTERKEPIKVKEYVFKSDLLSKEDIKMIISSLQKMDITNEFNEPTGKAKEYNRISVNPDYINLETTADGRVIPGGINGMDYSIEESKTHKNMKKETIKLNETQLRNMIAESVKKVLKEGNGQFSALYNDKNAPNSYGTKINELLRRYSDLQYEQEQLEKEISKYTDWSWDEFCEYANEKYGLTRQNMNTNWQNFADAEHNKEILNKRKEGSGFSTDGTRAF